MPDLSKEAVHAFWDSYDRRTVYRVLVALEGVETWVQDDPRLSDALSRLGNVMEKNNSQDVSFATVHEKLISILANLHATQAMRLLQALDLQVPGTAGELLTRREGNNDPLVDIFVKRNLAFERMQLLSRVFAAQRMTLVIKALEKEGV